MTKWFEALDAQGLEVQSASDGAQVAGWLDTGCYALNWAISGRFLRGYPLGHVVEIFGDPSTGKSFLVARALAQAQARGGAVLLDDTEGAYNIEWMQKLGVDTDKLAYVVSDTVSDHLATTNAFIEAYTAIKAKNKKLGPGVLACDSLAELTTEHEQEVQLEKRDMTKAKDLKAFFRLTSGRLHGLPIVHILTNHVIANIGNLFNKRTTGGGGGPKYQSSVRIDLRGTSKLKGETDYVGVWCRAVIDKNRLAPPWKEVRLVIPFYQPISRASGLIPALVNLGLLQAQGQFLKYQGQKIGRAYADDKKENALKQDNLGEELLDQVPEILEEADAWLEEHIPLTTESTVAEAIDDG
jgi:recombination protein RecA